MLEHEVYKLYIICIPHLTQKQLQHLMHKEQHHFSEVLILSSNYIWVTKISPKCWGRIFTCEILPHH